MPITLTPEIIKKYKDWINKNSFKVQGKDYFNNIAFTEFVRQSEKITDTKQAQKRVGYLLNTILKPKAIPLQKGRDKVVKLLGEAFDNNEAFKSSFKKRFGNATIANLTNDQLQSLKNTVETMAKAQKLIPKDAITYKQFLERSGLTKATVDSLRGASKNSDRGKEFNKLFKFNVVPNQATYISEAGLADKIKEYNQFREQDFIYEDTLKRVNKFKKSKVIQKYLDGKNTLLFTKKGRADAIRTLGGATPYQASYAMSILGRAYDGDNIKGVNVKPDKAKAEFIHKNLASLGARDPWSAPVYEQGLRQVNKELKGAGNFRTFKDSYTKEMNRIFDEMGIDKKYRTSINEIVSVKGAYRNQIAPYAAFVDLTRADLNEYIAGQQADLSKALKYLDENRKNLTKFNNKIKLFNEQTNPARLKSIEARFGKEAADQVRLASIVPGTDVESVYKKADLDRYAEKGLDLRKMSADKGYFLDVKGARPFFEVTKDDLRKAVSGLGKKDQLKYCSLLSRGGLPGDCAAAIDNNPVKAAQVFSEAPATSSAMTKVKNAASSFLNFAKRGGKFGALAAVGAAGAGAVKTFMNDDPTTYLSNEDQQKNMLIDMITDPIVDEPKTDSAIVDAQLPAVGAGAVAGTAVTAPSSLKAFRDKALGAKKSGVTMTGLKGLGRGLGTLGTPLGLLATEPLFIGGQIAEGDSLGEIATDPLNYLGASFLPYTDKLVSTGLSPQIAKTMRLGISPSTLKTVSRRFGLPGLALSLGISGYETFDDYRNKRGFFSEE
jgi:hypothetical protein